MTTQARSLHPSIWLEATRKTSKKLPTTMEARYKTTFTRITRWAFLPTCVPVGSETLTASKPGCAHIDKYRSCPWPLNVCGYAPCVSPTVSAPPSVASPQHTLSRRPPPPPQHRQSSPPRLPSPPRQPAPPPRRRLRTDEVWGRLPTATRFPLTWLCSVPVAFADILVNES